MWLCVYVLCVVRVWCVCGSCVCVCGVCVVCVWCVCACVVCVWFVCVCVCVHNFGEKDRPYLCMSSRAGPMPANPYLYCGQNL